MYTTLNEILKHGPCGIGADGESGFSKLLKNLNKTKADDEPLHIMDILKSNGIKDAIWSLKCFDYLDYCLFLADVAELASPEFESDNRPRKAIQAIRDYKSGLISREQLISAAYAACAAARDAYVAYSACAAAYAVAYSACAACAFVIGSWTKIEELFIKHFGVKE